jgi:two-component system phosphate regulon sensor histidine kinase PhoR
MLDAGCWMLDAGCWMLDAGRTPGYKESCSFRGIKMKQIKNSVGLTLMISSVVLLIALQFFWLRSSYEKAFIDFRRESSILFKTTVFGLRDSLFAKSIVPMKNDSIYGGTISKIDSIRVNMFRKDSLPGKFAIRERSSKVRVFISSTGFAEGDKHILNPLASTLNKFEGEHGFVVSLGPDTLNIDTLTMEFERSLRESGIDARFIINHIPIQTPLLRTARQMAISGDPEMMPEWNERQRKFYTDTLYTERVRLNPLHVYNAAFPSIRSEVMKEITPEILFSLLLTSIVVAAFVVMYRNLRAQQRLMQLKNDFISNVTHELKTPVATVSVALEALKDFHALENRERTKEYLSIAQNELARLTLMTDKILKASVFETQGVSFIVEHVNLHTIIEQVLSSMKLILEKKRISITYIPSGNDFEFEGSEVHMTNVIYNLVDNAIKYSGENTSIEIHLHNTADQLQFSIADHGIGIPPEYHKKVFEKFFRVPTGDVHNVKGYGLGLNYVTEVIRSHHGTITLNSSTGEGSCFTISLPRTHVEG